MGIRIGHRKKSDCKVGLIELQEEHSEWPKLSSHGTTCVPSSPSASKCKLSWEEYDLEKVQVVPQRVDTRGCLLTVLPQLDSKSFHEGDLDTGGMHSSASTTHSLSLYYSVISLLIFFSSPKNKSSVYKAKPGLVEIKSQCV